MRNIGARDNASASHLQPLKRLAAEKTRRNLRLIDSRLSLILFPPPSRDHALP
jgi:hypothetical protein